MPAVRPAITGAHDDHPAARAAGRRQPARMTVKQIDPALMT